MNEEQSFDEKMQELDERIALDQQSIDRSLFNIVLQILRTFRYTNNSGTPS